MRIKAGTAFYTTVLILAGLAVFGGVLWYFARNNAPWIPVVLVPVTLLGFHFYSRLSQQQRLMYGGFLVVVIAVYGLVQLSVIRTNINNPPVFDFQLFWLFGQASAQNLNPYQHDVLVTLALPLTPPAAMIQELYFFHAPPTLFWFAPLGWFNVNTAAFVWHVAHSFILLADIYLLWQLFIGTPRRIGLLFVAALVMMFYATMQNLYVSQVNYLLLLFTLLTWRDRQKPISGLWLAISIFIKPIAVVYGVYFVVRRFWRSIGVMVVTMAVISAITIAVYGFEMFTGYISNNPIVNNMPPSLYTEMGNQSLLATILRLTDADLGAGSAILNPIFIGAALVLTAVTVWLSFRLRENRDGWGLTLVVLLALLIFPKTLNHYSFLLLLPALLVWQRRKDVPGEHAGAVIFIGAMYFLVAYENGNNTFWAYLLSWIVSAAIIYRLSKRPDVAPASGAAQQATA